MALTATQIANAYFAVTDTQPNAPLLATLQAIDAGQGDAATITAIVNDPIAITFAYPIIRIFQLVTGALPDAVQLQGWEGFLESGGSLSQIATAFASGTFFQTNYNGGNPVDPTGPANLTEMINIISNALNLSTSTSQVQSSAQAWVAASNSPSGPNLSQIIVAFATGDQFSATTLPYVQAFLTTVATANENNAAGNSGFPTGSLFSVPLAPALPTLTLTTGPDAVITGQAFDGSGPIVGASNVIVSAPLAVAPLTSVTSNTLTTGDTIELSGPNNVLDATWDVAAAIGGLPVGSRITVQGVQTWNATVMGGATVNPDGMGATESITGLATLNVNNSSFGNNFVLGGAGAGDGIGSLLSTVGLTNDNDVVIVFVAASLLAPGSTLVVNLNNVGTASTDAFLQVVPDNPAAGGYATWAFKTTGTSSIDLITEGVKGAKTVTVSGSGTTQIDGSGGPDWSEIATISLANESGNVFITGAAAGTGYSQHGVTGFLLVNTVLTSYTGGSGNDIVDLSSLSTAQLQAMTTLNGGTGTTETLIVSNAVVEAASAAINVIANLTNFQVIGLSGAHAGTVVMANFPGATGLTDYGSAGGVQTVTATGVSTFTYNLNGFAEDVLTINGPTSGSNTLNVQLGGAGFFETAAAESSLIQLIDNNFGIANISSVGPAGTANSMAGNGLAETLTAPVGQSMAVNISGTDALDTNGWQLFGNGTSITDTDIAVLNMDDVIAGIGAFSTNAANINASASGGLSMEGGDSTTVGTAGDVITGSSTKANILVGSVGNDLLTVGIAGGDQIWTDGGGDVISLGVGHAKADTIFLAAETGNGTVNGALTTLLSGQVDVNHGINNAGTTQTGFFGNAPGATGAAASTSADMSTVANFVAGTAPTADNVTFGIKEWLAGGTYDGLVGVNLTDAPVLAGTSIFAMAANGATVTSTTADVLLLSGATFANAVAMATALGSGSFAVTVNTGATTTAGHTADLLVAYEDTSGNTRVADVSITESTTGAGTEALAGHVTAASDMVQLTGVALSSFVANNVHFIA